MATETTLKSRLIHCAKTTAQWSTNGTKIGKKGELLLEIIDTNHFKVKVGDGVTGYSSLPYMGEKWGDVIKIYNLTNTSTGTTKIANGDTLEQAMQKIQANLNTLNNKVYVTYSDTTPNAPTTSGSAGTSTKVSRGDHAHPKQQDSYIKNDANAAGGEDYRLVLIDNTTGTATFAPLCGSASNLKYDGLKFTATLSSETTWGGLSTSDFAKLTSGKISLSVIPDSVLGQLEYIGTWDATTGKAVSDTRPLEGGVIRAYRKGDYYIVKTAGTKLPDTKTITELDGLQIGDWIVYNGTTWDKIDNTDYIKTVAGITPTNGDISINTLVTELNKQSLIATTLKNARTFSLSGDVTATGVSFDGSDNVVLSTTISDNAVTTTKIKDANITTEKLADGAVTTEKLNNNFHNFLQEEIGGQLQVLESEINTKITELEQSVDTLDGNYTLEKMFTSGILMFELGSFNNDGSEMVNGTRLRSNAISTGFTVTLSNEGYLIHEVYYYNYWNSNSDFELTLKEVAGASSYTFKKTNGNIVRFSVRKADNSSITVNSFTSDNIVFDTKLASKEYVAQQISNDKRTEVIKIEPTYSDGGIINDGTFGTTSSENHSTFVRVDRCSKVRINSNNQFNICAFYDKNRNFITGSITKYSSSANNVYNVNVPTNAIYIVVASTPNYAETSIELQTKDSAIYDLLLNSSINDPKRAYYYNLLSELDFNNVEDNNPVKIDGTEGNAFQKAYINKNLVIQYDSSYRLSPLIPVYPNSLYRIRNIVSYIILYDKDKKIIGYSNGTTSVVTSNGCYYIRCAIHSNYFDQSSCYIRYWGLSTQLNDAKESLAIHNTNGTYDFRNKESLINAGFVKSGNNYILDRYLGERYTIRLQFKIPNDIHNHQIAEEFDIIHLAAFDLDTNSTSPLFYNVVKLAKGLTSYTYSDDLRSPNCPVPLFNAGFKAQSAKTGEILDYKPNGYDNVNLLGIEPMTIRFKGDCSQQNNQDIKIKIDSSVVRIYHSTNNTDIASFTKSDYSTMKDLYQAMLTQTEVGGSLENFEMNWLNVEGLVPNDIIWCDVPLVAEYYRNSKETETSYDAFPFYFTTVEKDKIHTLEIIVNGSAINILIDGDRMLTTPYNIKYFTNNYLRIAIADGVLSGVENISFTIDDKDYSIVPVIKVPYFEGVNQGFNPTELDTPQSIVGGTFELMRKNGFSYCTMEDVLKIIEGSVKPNNNKLFHVSHDDSAIEVVLNESIREIYLREKIYPSIAFFTPTLPNITEQEKKLLLAMNAVGFEYHLHAGYRSTSTNISYLSYSDLVSEVNDCINAFVAYFGSYPIVWNNHIGPINYNTCAYLRSKGFGLIMAGNGEGRLTANNRYCFHHTIVYNKLPTNNWINGY